MRDSEIEQWVLNEIRLTTAGRLRELCVFSSEGVVSLKGTVHSCADSLVVHAAAARAKGVIAVINHLNVRKKNLVRRRASVKSQIAGASGTFQLAQPNQFGSSPIAN